LFLLQNNAMSQDAPRKSKQQRVSVIMAKNISSKIVGLDTASQKIADKPEEEKKEKEMDQSLGPDGALQYCSKSGDLTGMKKAYQEGGKVNVPEQHPKPVEGEESDLNQCISGDYPLHMAIAGGHQEAVNLLLTWEADIESKNRIGSTPLIRAVSNDQIEIVRRLLKEGASVNATNKMGNTPLHCSAFVGSMEMTKLLIEAQASVNITQGNLYGATPLTIASKKNQSLFQYLFSIHKSSRSSDLKKHNTITNNDENHDPNSDIEIKDNNHTNNIDSQQPVENIIRILKPSSSDSIEDLDVSRIPAPSVVKDEEENNDTTRKSIRNNLRTENNTIPEETNKLIDEHSEVELSTWVE